MFVFSLLIATVSAGYYNNYPPFGFPPPPPPPHYAGYDDYFRDSRPKPCADLGTYLPRYPTVVNEAFYPPTIRYIKSGKRIQALVACDADGDTINALFSTKNGSHSLTESYLVSFGTSAGAVLTCQKNHTYTGSAVVDSAPGYSKNITVTSLACLRFDKTILGASAATEVTSIESYLSGIYNDATSARKKRETAEETTVAATTAATTAAAAEVTTQAAAAETTAAEVTTQASAAETTAAASAASTAATATTQTSILGGLGSVIKGL